MLKRNRQVGLFVAYIVGIISIVYTLLMLFSYNMIDLKKKEANRNTCFVFDFSVEVQITDKLWQEFKALHNKTFYDFMVEKIETVVSQAP